MANNLKCNECGSTNVTIEYGRHELYPDDYTIECDRCDNWEEGNGRPTQFTPIEVATPADEPKSHIWLGFRDEVEFQLEQLGEIGREDGEDTELQLSSEVMDEIAEELVYDCDDMWEVIIGQIRDLLDKKLGGNNSVQAKV